MRCSRNAAAISTAFIVKKFIPNILSIVRIIGGVVPIYYFYHRSVVALIVFLWVIAWTDFFDGLLARKWGCTSRLGAVLDPVGDKIVTIVYLIGLHVVWGFPGTIMWMAIIRDTFIIVGFLILRMQNKRARAKPTFMGKLNTLVLGFYVFACLTHVYVGESEYIFLVHLWEESFYWLLCVTLTLSFVDYIKAGLKAYRL